VESYCLGYNVIPMRFSAKTTNATKRPVAKPCAIVILVFDQSQMLDVAGPADAFALANRLVTSVEYSVNCVSAKGGLVNMSNGLSLMTLSIAQISPKDIHTLIIAGAESVGLRAALRDEQLEKWVKRVAHNVTRIASVCVGSFALAHWGLLNQRRATTHWSAVDQLQSNYPTVQVDRSAIFVRDGNIWTSGGVTTGIDMTLAMIELDTSRQVAGQVARSLIMSSRRLGNQAQYSTQLKAQSGRYAELIDWMNQNLNDSLSIASLASQANESERSFCRRFVIEVGQTPAQFVEELRLALAKQALLGGASVKSAAKQAGFTSQEHLSRTFRRRLQMTPQEFRNHHAWI
jgi:transcriptional regulator GlxA family with amidase domain